VGTAAVVTTVTGGLVTGGLLTAGPVALVPAARGLVLAAHVPAPAVATLGVARRGVVPRTWLAVLTGARRRAGRLLGSAALSLALGGGCLLRGRLLSRGLLGSSLL